VKTAAPGPGHHVMITACTAWMRTVSSLQWILACSLSGEELKTSRMQSVKTATLVMTTMSPTLPTTIGRIYYRRRQAGM